MVRSFLLAGVLTMIAAVVLGIWAVVAVERRNGGVVLGLLTAVLFVVGGGFVTLLFGLCATIAGAKTNAPLTWWRAHLPARLSQLPARLWPLLLIIYLVWVATSWAIGSLFNEFMLRVAPLQTALTPLVLAVVLLASFAYDIKAWPHGRPSEREPAKGATSASTASCPD